MLDPGVADVSLPGLAGEYSVKFLQFGDRCSSVATLVLRRMHTPAALRESAFARLYTHAM